jgi:hypothetical protein
MELSAWIMLNWIELDGYALPEYIRAHKLEVGKGPSTHDV